MEYDGFEYFEFFLSILLIFSKSGWSMNPTLKSPFPLADCFSVTRASVNVTAWYPFRLMPRTRLGFCSDDNMILPEKIFMILKSGRQTPGKDENGVMSNKGGYHIRLVLG